MILPMDFHLGLWEGGDDSSSGFAFGMWEGGDNSRARCDPGCRWVMELSWVGLPPLQDPAPAPSSGFRSQEFSLPRLLPKFILSGQFPVASLRSDPGLSSLPAISPSACFNSPSCLSRLLCHFFQLSWLLSSLCLLCILTPGAAFPALQVIPCSLPLPRSHSFPMFHAFPAAWTLCWSREHIESMFIFSLHMPCREHGVSYFVQMYSH